jgi:hypothetical protein
MLENNRGMNFSKGLQMLCCSEMLMNDLFTPTLDMGLSQATCRLQYCTTYSLRFSFIVVWTGFGSSILVDLLGPKRQ